MELIEKMTANDFHQLLAALEIRVGYFTTFWPLDNYLEIVLLSFLLDQLLNSMFLISINFEFKKYRITTNYNRVQNTILLCYLSCSKNLQKMHATIQQSNKTK